MSIRVGIVGCGNIFLMHAQSLVNTPGVELAAVCDIKPRRAAAAAKRYSCPSYRDYRVMLAEERLEAVHILTPHHLHAPMTLEALRRGVNVLTEKPIAITPRDAAGMVREAKRRGLTLGVISQNRYTPGAQLVKRCLTDGRLGSVRAARLVVSYHKPDSYYRKSDWKGRQSTEGGGVLIDQAIHFIDVLRWLIKDKVEYVEANTARRMHKSIEVEDLAEGLIKFRKGARIFFYLMNYYSYDADPEIEIDCTGGRVRMVKDAARVVLFDGRRYQAKPQPYEFIDYGEGRKDYWGFCHFLQIREYYRALRSGRQPQVDGQEGLETIAVVHGIYRSARLGRRIYAPLEDLG